MSRLGYRCHSGAIRVAATPPTLNDQRCAVAVGPFTHGTVIIPRSAIAQKLQNKQSVRRTDTPLSIRDDFFVGGCPDSLQHGPELVRRFDCLIGIGRHKVQPF